MIQKNNRKRNWAPRVVLHELLQSSTGACNVFVAGDIPPRRGKRKDLRVIKQRYLNDERCGRVFQFFFKCPFRARQHKARRLKRPGCRSESNWWWCCWRVPGSWTEPYLNFPRTTLELPITSWLHFIWNWLKFNIWRYAWSGNANNLTVPLMNEPFCRLRQPLCYPGYSFNG